MLLQSFFFIILPGVTRYLPTYRLALEMKTQTLNRKNYQNTNQQICCCHSSIYYLFRLVAFALFVVVVICNLVYPSVVASNFANKIDEFN